MKRRHLLSATKKVLVAGALAFLSLSPAQAFDGKIYAGSECVPYGANRYPTYNGSQIINPSATQWLNLDCPAVHDASSIFTGWVRAYDKHYSSNVNCNLNSLYASGTGLIGWWSPYSSTTGSSPNVQHLTFGSVGANSLSHYYYSCNIPPTYSGQASSITSYSVTEND